MSPWPDIDALLDRAASSVRLLAAVTPANAADERKRMIRASLAGERLSPKWQYARDDGAAAWVPRALEAVSRELPNRLPRALANVYLARIEELDLERRIACAAGRMALPSLARERFGTAGGRALELATRWASEAPSDADHPSVVSDSRHPSSLLSTMRARVSELGLEFRVVVHPSLASLAATGERTIYVAAGRDVPADVTRRTVMHETLAHALPRQRARSQPLGVFSFGTARGQDDQEGYALWLEETEGHMSATRRRELGARHVATRAMRDGGSFHDVVSRLRALGHDAPSAVTISERVFRGGTGTREGLGREAVYLAAYHRVSSALSRAPHLSAVLSSGQVSVRAAPTLAAFMAPASTRQSHPHRQSV